MVFPWKRWSTYSLKPWKHQFYLGKITIFKDFDETTFLLLRCVFYQKNLQKKSPKRGRNHEKIESKNYFLFNIDFSHFGLCFGTVLEAMLELKVQCWRLFGGLGRFLDASWASHGCSWAFLEDFGTILARFGKDFADILGGLGIQNGFMGPRSLRDGFGRSQDSYLGGSSINFKQTISFHTIPCTPFHFIPTPFHSILSIPFNSI